MDDSWTTRLTDRYKAMFDSPEIDDGTAVFNAYVYMQGFKDMYALQDADVSAVIVMRHRADTNGAGSGIGAVGDLCHDARSGSGLQVYAIHLNRYHRRPTFQVSPAYSAGGCVPDTLAIMPAPRASEPVGSVMPG